MRKRCEGYRNQSPALPSRASCSRCFMALNPIVPIRKRKNKNLALSATFLRLGAAAISLNTDISSKVQQINCWEAFFRLLRVGEDCQSKKSCRKGEIFVFKTSGSLQQGGCRSRRRCSKVVVAASGAAAKEVPRLAVLQRGCAAAGRCRGGRVSAMGRILRRSREALLWQRCRTKGGITVRLSDPAPPPRPVCTRMAPIGSI